MAILLFIAALALVFLDIFVPSGGMLLVLAASAGLGSILFGFRASNTVGMIILTLVIGAIPVLGVLAVRIWPHTPIGKRIVLKVPNPADATRTKEFSNLQDLIGHVVVSEYAMIPASQLTIGRKTYNAEAESGYIEAGQRVEVVAVKGRNLVVRPTAKPLRTGTSEANTSRSPPNGNLLDLPAEQLGLDSLDE
jgi:membrane-bound ClpP family serine protease